MDSQTVTRTAAELLMERETRIGYAPVPHALFGEPLGPITWQVLDDQFLLRGEGHHYFHYRVGDGITIERGADADLSEESLWLNGSVYAAIASLNGLLPIHASAVAFEGGVFAFTGPGGAGKSTLVAALGDRGLPMFCDDTLVLDLDADRRIVGEYCAIIADPGRNRLRLSRSPLRAPPLYCFHDQQVAVAGSVPRIFFAAGVPQRLNEVRVADSAMINYSDQEASWFEAIYRVPIGCIVELQRGSPRVLKRYYDPLAAVAARPGSEADWIAQVDELLDEAVRACLTGFRKPGITLSGGLDSPQVAVRTLAALPAGQSLPCFSFVPEQGYDGRVQSGMIGNERPLIEAFAAMHPRLEPHFTANAGYEHDHRWTELFHLMGGAPSGLCNMYVFHGLFAEAAKRDCDLLLVSDWGNNAFSDKGYCGFVEYFLTGRWRQLWLALRKFPIQDRSMLWRFVAQCLLPLLPDRLWRLARRIVFRNGKSALDLMQPLSREYRHKSGADRRLKQRGLVFERYQPWNKRHAIRLLLQDGATDWLADTAYRQLAGGNLGRRDPTTALFGTWRIHLTQLLLKPGLRFKVNELYRQTADAIA